MLVDWRESWDETKTKQKTTDVNSDLPLMVGS